MYVPRGAGGGGGGRGASFLLIEILETFFIAFGRRAMSTGRKIATYEMDFALGGMILLTGTKAEETHLHHQKASSISLLLLVQMRA